MSKSLSHVFNKGISPQQFIDQLTDRKDDFIEWSNSFEWTNEADKSFFEELSINRDDIRCFIIAAEWCGDVIRNIPVVFKALETAEIPVEVLIVEEFPEVMDEFLTMGGRAVPIVVFTDTGGHVLEQWGPRPDHVQAVMTAFKQNNPDRDAADYKDNIKVAYEEMARQYGEGTAYQSVIISELRDRLAEI